MQLHHLEHENSISRRRVRELELELEVCKRDVVRERTRVMEREEVIVQQQRDVSDIALSKKNKGKARAKDVTMNEDAVHEKYREAVEEKKGWCLPFYYQSLHESYYISSTGSSYQHAKNASHASDV